MRGPKKIPKLDVAGSIPVARSILTGGYSTRCTPPLRLLPKCCLAHRVSAREWALKDSGPATRLP